MAFKYRFPTFYGVPVVIRTAATRGHTNIIAWLCNERESVKKFPKGTIGNAVIAGQYETVRWLFEHYGDKFPRMEYFMDQAVGSGSVDVVRFLRDVVQCPLDETAILIASHKGDLDLIKWFYGEYPDWEWTAMAGSLIETAAKNGNLPIVKWSVETLDGWSVMALMCALQRYHL